MKTHSSRCDNDVYCKKCAICIYTELGMYAVCAGPCGNSFHIGCIDMSRDRLRALSNEIVWMCKECFSAFNTWKASQQESTSMLPDASSVNTDISLIKSQVSQIMHKLECIMPLNTSSPTSHSTPIAASEMISGSNSSDMDRNRSAPNNTPTTTTKDDCFSLLLSNIDSTVPESVVESMVYRCLGVPVEDRIIVKKLVSKHIDCSSLDYISFKIDVKMKWKDKAMRASTWPSDIKFREFQRRPFNTWKP